MNKNLLSIVSVIGLTIGLSSTTSAATFTHEFKQGEVMCWLSAVKQDNSQKLQGAYFQGISPLIGELKFEFLVLKLISKNTASLKGKWELIRESDNPNGLFWLDLQKFDKKWLITKDSTISFEINIPLSLLECDKNNPS